MRALVKFLRLPRSDRQLLIHAALLVWAIRLGLWLLPFRSLQRILARMSKLSDGRHGSGPVSPDRIAWAVTVASCYVPAATCLTQALAARVLLERRGIPADLRIGVARDATRKFEAHAWIESQGQIVIGGSVESVVRYKALLPLTGDHL